MTEYCKYCGDPIRKLTPIVWVHEPINYESDSGWEYCHNHLRHKLNDHTLKRSELAKASPSESTYVKRILSKYL